MDGALCGCVTLPGWCDAYADLLIFSTKPSALFGFFSFLFGKAYFPYNNRGREWSSRSNETIMCFYRGFYHGFLPKALFMQPHRTRPFLHLSLLFPSLPSLLLSRTANEDGWGQRQGGINFVCRDALCGDSEIVGRYFIFGSRLLPRATWSGFIPSPFWLGLDLFPVRSGLVWIYSQSVHIFLPFQFSTPLVCVFAGVSWLVCVHLWMGIIGMECGCFAWVEDIAGAVYLTIFARWINSSRFLFNNSIPVRRSLCMDLVCCGFVRQNFSTCWGIYFFLSTHKLAVATCRCWNFVPVIIFDQSPFYRGDSMLALFNELCFIVCFILLRPCDRLQIHKFQVNWCKFVMHHRLIDWLMDGLMDWWMDGWIDWLIDCWWIDRMMEPSFDWLIDWLIVLLIAVVWMHFFVWMNFLSFVIFLVNHFFIFFPAFDHFVF